MDWLARARAVGRGAAWKVLRPAACRSALVVRTPAVRIANTARFDRLWVQRWKECADGVEGEAFCGRIQERGHYGSVAEAERAARDVGAVLSVVTDAAGQELMRAVLPQLPPGYDLLCGRPQP